MASQTQSVRKSNRVLSLVKSSIGNSWLDIDCVLQLQHKSLSNMKINELGMLAKLNSLRLCVCVLHVRNSL